MASCGVDHIAKQPDMTGYAWLQCLRSGPFAMSATCEKWLGLKNANHISVLVPVKTWYRTSDKPLVELMMTKFTDEYLRHYSNQFKSSATRLFVKHLVQIITKGNTRGPVIRKPFCMSWRHGGIKVMSPIRIITWWRHQMETFSALLAFVRGIHRSPMNSPRKGQWRGALMCSLICAWINGWVNNREAGDLKRHRTRYDATVMAQEILLDLSWKE